MGKVVCVLYDDPVDGYPKTYARDDIPKITHYPDGQTTPTPSAIDFRPGQLLGSVSGELGLRKFLEKAGHTLVVTSDKDGANSTFDRHCHVNRKFAGQMTMAATVHAATVAWRQVNIAWSRNTRRVRREFRWRWMLNTL